MDILTTISKHRQEISELISRFPLTGNLASDVRKIKPLFKHIQENYGSICSSTQELIYWVSHVEDPDFIDRMKCASCGQKVNYSKRNHEYSKYCLAINVKSTSSCNKDFSGSSEKEIMEDRGYDRIFGCGNYIYSLDFNKEKISCDYSIL